MAKVFRADGFLNKIIRAKANLVYICVLCTHNQIWIAELLTNFGHELGVPDDLIIVLI